MNRVIVGFVRASAPACHPVGDDPITWAGRTNCFAKRNGEGKLVGDGVAKRTSGERFRAQFSTSFCTGYKNERGATVQPALFNADDRRADLAANNA